MGSKELAQVKKAMPDELKRTIGFAAAVEDLLKRIAEKRPDLFGLWFVCDEVKAWWKKNGGAK